MALINCPECQREISNQSHYCIHCGFPMAKDFKDNHLIDALIKNDEERAKKLIIRAQLALEDEAYSKAEELTEKALELDPKLSDAYILRLLVSLQVSDEKEMIIDVDRPLTEYKDYNRAIRFAQVEDKEKLREYNREVLERFENEKNEQIYQKAKDMLERAVTEEDFRKVAVRFESISEYKDALEHSKESRQQEESERQQKVYHRAVEKMESANDKEQEEAASLLQEAGKDFQTIANYKDAKERKRECEEVGLRLKRESTYLKAMEKKKTARLEQEYQEAAKLFYTISDYKNAESLARECEEHGKKVGSDYLENLLKKRKRNKIMKKTVITVAVVTALIMVILGSLTNFTYSLEEFYNLQQGQEEYLWQEVFEQIKDWFSYIGGLF